jgi:nucleotide-binding universal stress UspA family protein
MSSGPIVAGTDGSATARLAMDKAAELAQALEAPVHVVCVPGAIAGVEWPQRISAQEIVNKVAERLRGQGITVQTHLPQDQGDAGLTLVAVADSVQAQMIVIGNKGMTGVRRLLGSLPNTVTHQARCDVLIVPTQSASVPEFAGGAIVAGTDGSSTASVALREAIRLAKALGGELHIVTTVQPAEPVLSAAATEAADQGVSATTHALSGDPADAILGVSEQQSAAIVVVGTKGMHSDDRERFGNIPDKISHKGNSSVMLVFTGDAGGGNGEAMSGAVAGDAEG